MHTLYSKVRSCRTIMRLYVLNVYRKQLLRTFWHGVTLSGFCQHDKCHKFEDSAMTNKHLFSLKKSVECLSRKFGGPGNFLDVLM